MTSLLFRGDLITLIKLLYWYENNLMIVLVQVKWPWWIGMYKIDHYQTQPDTTKHNLLIHFGGSSASVHTM